jgi:hypothetical protein
MGREATCICDWNGAMAEVKALIEPPELILRGAIRRRIPIAEMKQVRVEDDLLCFIHNGERVALRLGTSPTAKWADALLKPSPTLAMKLGISSETTVRMIGKVDDPALEQALAAAKEVSTRSGDLILARVSTPDDLKVALAKSADALERGTPIWFIFRKGAGYPLNETLVRSTALAAGIVDTKVAAVSASLTALRFVKRKS